uniref:Lipocalin n=1 Tax=Rhipicephalus appendiculatus TaxID=34631 RepID=A0A131Z1Z8_RHIAP
MQNMLSKWTMIWSLWLLCPIVLAGEFWHHPCYYKFVRSGLAECKKRLGGSEDPDDYRRHVTMRSWNEDESRPDQCFQDVYGPSDEECLSSKKFRSLFLCLWDRKMDEYKYFLRVDISTRPQLVETAEQFRECLVEYSDNSDDSDDD